MTTVITKVAQKTETSKLIEKELIEQNVQKGIDKYCSDNYCEDIFLFKVKSITTDFVVIDFQIEDEKETLHVNFDSDDTLEGNLYTVFGDTENFIFNIDLPNRLKN